MKIALVGESPHDTISVQKLLNRIYPDFTFIDLIPDIRGSQLDQQQPTKQRLRLEYQFEKPNIVIFIRDLDSLGDDKDAIRKKYDYFREYRSIVDKRAVYLLFIWEIEAMIFFDLDTFMTHYKCMCVSYPNPHEIKEPKEELKKLHRKYSETDNPTLFQKIEINALKEGSTYFRHFLKNLDKQIGQ